LGKPAPQGAFDAFALADPRARMEAVRQQMMGGAAHTFGFDPRHFAERLSPEQAFDEIRRVHDEKEAELPQQSLSTRASDKFELSFPVIDPMSPSDPMFAVDPANPFPQLESDFELNQTLKPAHAQATGGRALEDANEQTSNDATGVVDPRTRMEAVRQQMMNGAAGSLGLHPHQFSAHMSPEEVRSAVDRLRSSKESLGQRVVEAVQAGTADLADAPMMTAGSLPVVPDMASPVAAGVALSPEEVNAEIDRIHALKEAVLQQLSGGRVENNAQQAAAQSTDATGPRLSPRSHQIGTRMSPEQVRAEIERVRTEKEQAVRQQFAGQGGLADAPMMTAGSLPVVPDMASPVAAGVALSPEEVNAEIDRIHALKESVLQQLSAGRVENNAQAAAQSTDATGPRLSPRSHQIGTRMSPEQIAEIERVRQQMSAGVSTDLSPEQAQAEIERVYVLKETIRQQLAAGQEVVSNPVDVIKIPISTDPTGPVAAAAADSSDLPQLTSRSQRAPAVVVADEHLTAGRQLSQSSNLRGSLTSASNGPSIVDANVIHADKIRPDFHHREVESAPAMKSSTSSDAEKKPFHALMEPLSHARGGIMKALQEVVNKLQVTN